jgi:hypothetical protein
MKAVVLGGRDGHLMAVVAPQIQDGNRFGASDDARGRSTTTWADFPGGGLHNRLAAGWGGRRSRLTAHQFRPSFVSGALQSV